MKIVDLRPGLRVRHTELGLGDVKVLTETNVEILFNDGRKTLTAEQVAELKPDAAIAHVEGLDKPLRDLISDVVEATIDKLELKVTTDDLEPQIGARWPGGKLVLHPRDSSLATKEIELEVFFRKIISVRDNLRVLEQKINTHPKLADADRLELQHYITKSYGSLTTFNLLFKDKDQNF